MPDEMMVTYSVKEVLERLERKIDDLRINFDDRISVLEADKTAREKRADYRRWFYPFAATTTIGLLTVVATLLLVVIP